MISYCYYEARDEKLRVWNPDGRLASTPSSPGPRQPGNPRPPRGVWAVGGAAGPAGRFGIATTRSGTSCAACLLPPGPAMLLRLVPERVATAALPLRGPGCLAATRSGTSRIPAAARDTRPRGDGSQAGCGACAPSQNSHGGARGFDFRTAGGHPLRSVRPSVGRCRARFPEPHLERLEFRPRRPPRSDGCFACVRRSMSCRAFVR